jgi:protease-4
MKQLLIIFAVLIAIALLLAGLGIMFTSGTTPLGGPRVLVWNIDAPLLDYSEAPDLQLFRRQSPQGFASVYRLLDAAAKDDNVAGVVLNIQQARLGFAKAQEVRALLREVSESGKFVDCYLESAGVGNNGTIAYLLATSCQSITLPPLGEINLVGLFADSSFFKGTLDKLKIEPQMGHVGEYKSAAETFMETEHSAAAEEALTAVLDDLFEQIVAAVSESRELPLETVRELIDRAPLSPEEALEAGLIDEIAYPDNFEDQIKEKAGDDARLVSLSDYTAGGGDPFSSKKLAVVFAQGAIIRGSSGTDPWSQQRYIGADSMREILRGLKDDDDVEAVVLRINSPGGSPVASDLILRELELLREEKPIIVSMSDVAASGGYYIAAKATSIVADPATITGSIGVVGGKLATGRFQEELLGITHDEIKRGANADFYSSVRPWSQDQAAQFQDLMQRTYDLFVDQVASGRGMTRDEVDAVARGRIWSGERAKEVGLVDELGGLHRALALAREAAEIDPEEDVYLDFYPRPPSLLEALAEGLAPFLQSRSARFSFLPRLDTPIAFEVPPDLLRPLLGVL